jgi:hypothetical protein
MSPPPPSRPILKELFQNTSLNQKRSSTTVSIQALLQVPIQLPNLIDDTNITLSLNHAVLAASPPALIAINTLGDTQVD